ncbi:DNA polymerase alpha/primase associated subunit [Histoplasma capsulatum G186AR]|uniref:DNA polymerase alpha subunit B n=2 Tax=Ajellomyces capsulatus TaxID=5037 RepID=C0NFE0_AJECG|nr:DNA polymerase alpha/primase associated subunit [Histoplasma capsulatum G186AR]EEH09961.1 DNA polymerase alpha/primase associated subunit [Histoplasma capsulatum G186AR]KAG5291095.1 DNA polymerase alpha/primase associated subunit [Histoplasma capsulatum]QSS73023.1 DNA polymerase alpha/primase associated subunit [Histoplasma capsulatum G186AR]
MEVTGGELDDAFSGSCPSGVPQDVATELRSIMRLHSMSAQDLSYKWDAYCLKMGAEETALNLDTVRGLKRDIQDVLERESRGKAHMRGTDKRNAVSATPRAATNNRDVFEILDDFAASPHSRTNNGASVGAGKRKAAFGTPSTSKVGRVEKSAGSLGNPQTPLRPSNGDLAGLQPTPFAERQNSGQVLETINTHLSMSQPPIAPYPMERVKPTANTDMKKFAYKPMSMHLNEASEVLDNMIDEFMAIIQKHHGLDDTVFGSAANQSTKEIIAVGRIASDSLEGKLNTASLVLETSRRSGAGLRIPLKIDSLPSVQFFPGQIVALRGINASREYFTVFEVLSTPLLPPAASPPAIIQSINDRLGDSDAERALNILIASGPFTADDNLDFEPLRTLCAKAADEYADALILTGPFLDLEHPLVASGDFDLPDEKGLDPDNATLSSLFQCYITPLLKQLASAVPSICIFLVPSVRDAISKHVSFPQEKLLKRDLDLFQTKQVRTVPNPVTLSLNENVFGMCSHDVLYELRQEEVLGGRPSEGGLLTRLSRYLIEQRHFLPVFPPTARGNLPKSGVEGGLATGAMLDTSYLKLGEWWNVRPDVLITPSILPPFVKVVEGVLVINPGTLSKRKAAGSFAQMTLHPRTLTEEEMNVKQVGHKVYERARVDVIRI